MSGTNRLGKTAGRTLPILTCTDNENILWLETAQKISNSEETTVRLLKINQIETCSFLLLYLKKWGHVCATLLGSNMHEMLLIHVAGNEVIDFHHVTQQRAHFPPIHNHFATSPFSNFDVIRAKTLDVGAIYCRREPVRIPASPSHGGPKTDGGFWVDSEGKPIHVSASDVERFVHCPMSWRLSQEGVAAKGEEVRRGIEEHERLHTMIIERNQAREQFTKNLVIWSWWFSVAFSPPQIQLRSISFKTAQLTTKLPNLSEPI